MTRRDRGRDRAPRPTDARPRRTARRAPRRLARRSCSRALLAYVPLLLTQPGQVGADTKTYLYLDPARAARARRPTCGTSQIGLGTVTHQNIGYLWPMGPFYWVFETLGVPDWVAQRLWLGTVLFAAALGVRYLLRDARLARRPVQRRGRVRRPRRVARLHAQPLRARLRGPHLGDPAAVGGAAVAHRPHRAGRCATAAGATRRWFALVVLTVGGINATALILVGARPPLLWVVHAVWIEREVTAREAPSRRSARMRRAHPGHVAVVDGRAVGRRAATASRSSATPRPTETVAEVVERARGAAGPRLLVLLRQRQARPVDRAERRRTPTASWLLGAQLPRCRSSPSPPRRSCAGATGRYFLAVLVRRRARSPSPATRGTEPSPARRRSSRRSPAPTPAWRCAARPGPCRSSSLGHRRSSSAPASRALGRRASPLAPAPPAAGAGRRCWSSPTCPPLWNGTMVAENLKRPEEIPPYWLDAAACLDGHEAATTPGCSRSPAPTSPATGGATPSTRSPPASSTAPYVARELFQYGSPAPSADLLNALDRPLPRGHDRPRRARARSPGSWASATSCIRSDLQYERFRTARPRDLWDLLERRPGLGDPITFGPPTPNVAGPEQPLIDEIELALDPDLADPPAGRRLPRRAIRCPIVRDALGRAAAAARRATATASSTRPASGSLDPDQAIFYAAIVRRRRRRLRPASTTTAPTCSSPTPTASGPAGGARSARTPATPSGRRGAAALRPHRPAPRGLPRRGATTPTTRRPSRRGGVTVHRHRLRQPGHLHPRRPRRPTRSTATRSPPGGSAPRRPRRRATRHRPRRAGHHRPPQPAAADQRSCGTAGSPGPAALRRRRRRTSTSTSTRRRATGPGSDGRRSARAHVRAPRDRDPETDVGKRPRYDGLSGVGFAEVTHPGRRAGRRAGAPADRPARRGRHRVDRPPPRLAVHPAALQPGRAGPHRRGGRAAPRRRAADRTRLRRRRPGPAVAPTSTDDAIDRAARHARCEPGRHHRDLVDAGCPGSLERRARAAIDGDPDHRLDDRVRATSVGH